MTLSKRQQQILSIISSFTQTKGFAPSYREIMQILGLSSVATVYKHIQNLKASGHLDSEAHKWRALKSTQVLGSTNQHTTVSLPLIGSIAKNMKIEISAKVSFCEVPETIAPKSRTCYGFIVQDNSFLSEHILRNDLVVIEARDEPKHGEMILVSTEKAGALIGRYVIKNGEQTLQNGFLDPSGAQKESFSLIDESYHIQGIIIGLIRHW